MTSEKTLEKYRIFIAAYVNTFNATQAAISAGYSKKTAYSQGNRLLKNDEVKALLDEQIKKLRERMSDDASKIYAMLWNQLKMVDDKIDKHDEAQVTINSLEKQLIPINVSLAKKEADKSIIKRKADEIDGRRNRELKRSYLEQIKKLDCEMAIDKYDKKKIYAQMAQYKMYLLDPFAWEKILTMRANILRDLLDRAGYKTTDKLEVQMDAGVTIIDDIEPMQDG
ncbi:terminase small subunit [Listeria monocytogenes]|uniref:terminase small subunit n=1 Tax=Listeria monocytogenes TaxID=1639 RepID=UPI0034A43356|nr:terminase small subunit [Listeria monocytogenes]EJN4467359.1 terminase small subunit [Listeria monocytogenes]